MGVGKVGEVNRIPPRSGVGFELRKGQYLHVIDPEGEQVGDLAAFNFHDRDEYLSSGRTIDYAASFLMGEGATLYSNRSNPMLTIVRDEVGRHDFLLTPCSKEMFAKLYDDPDPPPGCQGNLEMALAPYGIPPDRVPVAFNVFMHVDLNGKTGEVKVLPPLSKPGQRTVFRAEMDLVCGLTACSAGQSNNFRYKPIDWRVSDSPE